MIVFSDHAEEQLRRRKISRKLVEETVRSPEEILESFRGRKLRRKRFGGKILEIVTITKGSRMTVVTQYWLKQEDI